MSPRLAATGLAISKPLYIQVRDLLFQRVRNNEWASGQTLPNEFSLANEFGVSIGTLRRAVEALEGAGILVRKQGRGTFVAGTNQWSLRERASSLFLSTGQRVELTYRTSSISTRPAYPHEASRLGVAVGESVTEIVQGLRGKDGTRGVERTVVRTETIGEGARESDFDKPIYLVYSKLGLVVTRADERLFAISASADDAKMLDVAVTSPLLKAERTTYSLDDRPIDCRTGVYVTGSSSYRVEIGQRAN